MISHHYIYLFFDVRNSGIQIHPMGYYMGCINHSGWQLAKFQSCSLGQYNVLIQDIYIVKIPDKMSPMCCVVARDFQTMTC